MTDLHWTLLLGGLAWTVLCTLCAIVARVYDTPKD